MSSFGYYSVSVLLPHNMGRLPEKGIMYSYKYILRDLGSITIDPENEIRIFLEGNFDIGGGLGEAKLLSEYPDFENGKVKYYAGTVDLFSVDITPEYTYIFSDGRALTTKLGFNFLNIGGTLVTASNGEFAKNSLGVLNIIPFSIKPSMYFDFGRSGVGLSFLINPTSFLSYVFSSIENYSEKERGLKAFDTTFKRYVFQILYTF